MQLVNFLCFLNHLFCNNASDKPSFQDVLQSKKHNFRKFAASAFEVGVNGRRIFWILLVMRDLNTWHCKQDCCGNLIARLMFLEHRFGAP